MMRRYEELVALHVRIGQRAAEITAELFPHGVPEERLEEAEALAAARSPDVIRLLGGTAVDEMLMRAVLGAELRKTLSIARRAHGKRDAMRSVARAARSQRCALDAWGSPATD
jgi:hypothetical protein